MELNEFLYIKLNQLKKDLGFDDFIIKCYNEQEFANSKPLDNEISIVTKKMVSTLTFNTVTTPYQILVMSEQNSLESVQALLNAFSTKYNWYVLIEGTTYTKMQYSQPMVMNNFEIVGCGYRSVLFISATTYELKDVIDIKNLKINGEEIKPIGVSIGYGANTDSVQYPNEELCDSVKTSGALGMSLIVPSTNSVLVNDALKIAFGLENGNKNFVFDFYIGNIHVENLNMKQIELAFSTAVNDIPSVQIAYSR